MAKQTKNELAFSLLDWQEQRKWRDEALKKYDDVWFCPVCRGLLTGMHERTTHFQNYLNKRAANLWAKETKDAEKNHANV